MTAFRRLLSLGGWLFFGGLLALSGCAAPSLPPSPPLPPSPSPSPSPVPSPFPSPSPIPGEVPAYQRLLLLGKGAPRALAWSPDGTRLAVATAAGVALYTGAPLTETERLAPAADVTALAWSPEGTRLAWGEQGGRVFLWDVAASAPRRRLEGAQAAVTALAFSPDGGQVAVGRADGTLTLWQPAAGTTSLPLRGHTDRLTALAFCGELPDTESPALYSASRDGSLTVWNAPRAKLRSTLRLEGAPLRALACAPERGWVYSADESGLVQVWGPQGQVLRSTLEAGLTPSALALAPQGWLALGSAEGDILLWAGELGAPLRRIRAHQSDTLSLAYRPGTDTLASLGRDGRLALWQGAPQVNRQTETPPPRLEVRGFAGRVQQGFLRGGVLLSAHADGALRLWSLEEGRLLRTLPAHRGAVTGLAFEAAGGNLLSAGLDGAVRSWGWPGGDAAGTLYTRRPLSAFALAGRWLATAGTDGWLGLWREGALEKEILLPGGEWAVGLGYQPPDTLWALTREGELWAFSLPALEPRPAGGRRFPGGARLVCAAECRRMAVLDGAGGAWLGGPGASWEALPPPAEGSITALWLPPEEGSLLLGMESGEVWALEGGEARRLFRESAPPVWLSMGEGYLWVGMRNGQVGGWRAPPGSP